MVLVDDDHHLYCRNDFGMFNMLRSPVWVFDIDQQAMYWANTPALRVWNAASLEELLMRDFASDMSDASLSILLDWKTKLVRNECVNEQWTLYPQGVPTTLDIFCSAIRIEDGRIAMLVEAEIVDLKRVVDDSTVRRFEILKHLPIAVSQFTLEGDLIYQNPQALQFFGSSSYRKETDVEEIKTLNINAMSNNLILQRFVNVELGLSAISKARDGVDFSAEAQLLTRPLTESNKNCTAENPATSQQRWFNVLLRRTRDPITSEFVILLIARDISDIVRARQQTTQAAMKSEFLDVMAHEIRTPLHQIIGHVDLLENSVLDEEQLESVQQVQSSSSMLMSIINDLLDCSKLEYGQVQIENVTFALDSVVNGCIASIQPQAQKKGITVSSNVHACCAPYLSSDPNRLRQVLHNLLSNAVKFTEVGSVTLSVKPCLPDDTDTKRRTNETTNVQWLRFDVKDTGIGIDPKEQDAVFERYRQANSSVARRFGGTGLGLPICKGFVELMNGTIGLKSVVGRGTTFYFELPFQVVRVPKDNLCVFSPKPQAMVTKVPAAASLKVLVVEDNKVNQKVVQSMLTRLGHSVTLAENGQVALNELHQDENLFHVILMDIQMPVMDGIECTKYIRNVLQIGKEQLPIVGLTAGLQRSEKEFYENEVGMNACLGKPMPLEALRNALAAFQSLSIEDKSSQTTMRTLLDASKRMNAISAEFR
jgi:signal transduction histidine kinase/DNA-binding NarL/FixJ family response regulator